MRKIILLITLCSTCAFAQKHPKFILVKSSIKTAQVNARMTQNVDLIENDNTAPDSVFVTISQIEPHPSTVRFNTTIVSRQSYKQWKAWSLPSGYVNPDGTRSILFNIPEDYLPFPYRIVVNISSCSDSLTGIIRQGTTSIEDDEEMSNQEIEKIEYYDLNGRVVGNPIGVFIVRIFYKNGRVISRKELR